MEQVKCWEDLVQVANEIVNSSTDNDIASILRCHLHDIYAFIFPMLQINCCKSNTVEVQKRAANIIKFLSRCLSQDTIKRQAARKAYLVAIIKDEQQRCHLLQWRQTEKKCLC